jgi:hypothetical protein
MLEMLVVCKAFNPFEMTHQKNELRNPVGILSASLFGRK